MTRLSWTRVFAVLMKEFKQLTRDRVTYAMMLGIPVLQLVLFGYAINTEPRHLPTAVLMQEDSRYARSITAALKNSRYFDFVAQARSPAELDAMIRRGEVQFAITVPGDFSRRVARADEPQVLVEVDATDPAATGRCRRWPRCPPRRWPTTSSARRPRAPRRPRPSRWSCTASTTPRPSPPTTSSPASWASC